jgi:hypothetical protein
LARLLEPYDHNLPYLVTDNYWFRDNHPSRLAPRCLPCHVTGETITTHWDSSRRVLGIGS